MTIRNKLLILLLSVSLAPLSAYFILDVSFSRIVRDRIQKTLRSALEERAKDTLVLKGEVARRLLSTSFQAVSLTRREHPLTLDCVETGRYGLDYL